MFGTSTWQLQFSLQYENYSKSLFSIWYWWAVHQSGYNTGRGSASCQYIKRYISERVLFSFIILSIWMSFEAHNFPTGLLYQVNTRRVQVSTRRQTRAPSASGRDTAKCNKAAGEHLCWPKKKKKKKVTKSTPQLRNLCNCLPIFSLYLLEEKDDLTLCVPTIISHFGGHPNH